MQQDMDDTNPSPGQDEKAESFGKGSFTTNTFNARLVGSHGMAILKYIQSEEFGKYGESIKLIANINVSCPCFDPDFQANPTFCSNFYRNS